MNETQLLLFDPSNADLLKSLFKSDRFLYGKGVKISQQINWTPKLSKQQLQIMTGLANNLTIDQIALALDISPNTVKKQLERIRTKTGVDTTASMAIVVSLGMIKVGAPIENE